jgi:recombination protein RecA
MTSRDATAAALATLGARWGAAAPRPWSQPDVADDVVSTGFGALDAIIGPGGLPRGAGVALLGDATSGRTTLTLRLVAEAQAAGSLVAWVDLARSLDAVEAVARGVRLEWLVVLTPKTIEEGLAMAGALLQGRAVDLLVLDLPDAPSEMTNGRSGGRSSDRPGGRPPTVVDRLNRLGALARRNGTGLVVLGSSALPAAVRGAIDEATGLRLALARRGWIHLGRDVVGQRVEVAVERSRYGPPGRRAGLRILYAEGGDRDACLRRPSLLDDRVEADRAAAAITPLHLDQRSRTIDHATPPSPLAASPPPSRTGADRLRLVPPGPDRPRRAAVGRRDGARHEPGGGRDGRPSRDAARERPPARP